VSCQCWLLASVRVRASCVCLGECVTCAVCYCDGVLCSVAERVLGGGAPLWGRHKGPPLGQTQWPPFGTDPMVPLWGRHNGPPLGQTQRPPFGADSMAPFWVSLFCTWTQILGGVDARLLLHYMGIPLGGGHVLALSPCYTRSTSN